MAHLWDADPETRVYTFQTASWPLVGLHAPDGGVPRRRIGLAELPQCCICVIVNSPENVRLFDGLLEVPPYPGDAPAPWSPAARKLDFVIEVEIAAHQLGHHGFGRHPRALPDQVLSVSVCLIAGPSGWPPSQLNTKFCGAVGDPVAGWRNISSVMSVPTQLPND